jgi:hypothetical protein
VYELILDHHEVREVFSQTNVVSRYIDDMLKTKIRRSEMHRDKPKRISKLCDRVTCDCLIGGDACNSGKEHEPASLYSWGKVPVSQVIWELWRDDHLTHVEILCRLRQVRWSRSPDCSF